MCVDINALTPHNQSSCSFRLPWTLSDDTEGTTLVTLTDGQWLDDDPNLPFCNTRWAEVLFHLKEYVETGA